MNGRITHYFSCAVSPEDVSMFGFSVGDSDGQQLWEALAMLTAIDIWSDKWKGRRIVLKITGDNVTALTLVTKMSPPGPELAIIARELALRLIDLSFPPDA